MRVHDIHIEGFPPFKIGADPNFYADWALMSYLAAAKLPEPEVAGVIRRVVRPGDVVIDGGANVGFYSLLMSGMVGETGRVLAFEPSPPNIEKFQSNRDLNRMTNVALYTDALWSEAATLDFFVGRDTGQSAVWSSADSMVKCKVRAIPLDAIAPVLAAGVRFAKLDLEGAEERALLGASSLLERGFPTYVVCELQPLALAQLDCHQDSLRSLMQRWGYQTFLIHDDGGLPTLVPERTVIRPRGRNANVMFARVSDVCEAWPEASA